ncbi:MAG: prephenate dehydratase domain-containing protein [Candidatus Paceibacterota bacterium]
MKKTAVVTLGSSGATFSSAAYKLLANIHGVESNPDNIEFLSVDTNSKVIRRMLSVHPESSHFQSDVFGVLAVETMADGKIDESLNTFVTLLENENPSRISIIGAIRQKINLALMAKVDMNEIVGVVGHERALGACKENLSRLGVEQRIVDNNEEASMRVSWKHGYEKFAALGPAFAGEKYGLKVINSTFEDTEAVTTFVLLKTGDAILKPCESNKILAVFRLKHIPGALAQVLYLLRQYNLTNMHSVYTGNGTYDFLIELECPFCQIENCLSVFSRVREVTQKLLTFGPFGVIER